MSIEPLEILFQNFVAEKNWGWSGKCLAPGQRLVKRPSQYANSDVPHSFLQYILPPSLLSLVYRYSDNKYLLSSCCVPDFKSEMLGDLPRVTISMCEDLEACFLVFPTSHLASPHCSPAPLSTFSNAVLRRPDRQAPWKILADQRKNWWHLWEWVEWIH